MKVLHFFWWFQAIWIWLWKKLLFTDITTGPVQPPEALPPAIKSGATGHRCPYITESQVISGTPESDDMTGYCLLPFKMGITGVPFPNRIIVNFLVYQDQLETNLLQLFAHPSNSEWFHTISAIIFEANAVAVQKHVELVASFFARFRCPQFFYCPSCPTAVPASLAVSVLNGARFMAWFLQIFAFKSACHS